MRRGWVLGVLLTGCAHTVVLDSQPPGAQVEVDGNLIGTTPVSFVDHASIRRTYDVVLKLPAHRTKRASLTQQFQVTTLCCPVFLPVGWELPEEHYTWTLEPDDGTKPAVPGLTNAPP
ncbi:MAG: PEGA domain-containing protein [Deltaproteobacteria bacterium]|nr:PEGA domain-containing protein [Deltaproteobacteria bacterium]